MTDKIMIDGVNVKECENFFANGCDIGEGVFENCEGKDCLYKQLKRKEEECEKLKSEKSIKNVCLEQSGKYSMKCGEYRQILNVIQEVAQRLRTKRDYRSPDEVNADIDTIIAKCEVALKTDD